MMAIKPIHLFNATLEFREFFPPCAEPQRMTDRGHWLGPPAKLLQLRNPIELAPFRHLLTGRSPDGAKKLLTEPPQDERLMAWRLDFRSSEGLNTLWALSPRRTQLNIEKAHRRAVRGAIAAVEVEVTETFPERTPEKEPTALFAVFRGGSPDQLPDLHTTAFLFNLKFQSDGAVSTFDSEKLQDAADRLLDFYNKLHYTFVWQRIGVPEYVIDHDLRVLGISPALYSKIPLQKSGPLNPGEPRTMNSANKEHRLIQWQRQAQAFGWGTKEAQSYLRYARRNYAIEDLMNKCRKTINRGINLVLGPPGFPGRVRDQRSMDPPSNNEGHGITHSH